VACVEPPPHRLDAALDALRDRHRLGVRWHASRYAWLKQLLPAQKGRVGEQLFRRYAAYAGCDVGPRRGTNDCTVNGRGVEVKLATLHDTSPDGDDIVQWLQLRPESNFDVAALLAVCPDHTHLWVVDRDVVLGVAVGQHGGRNATETRQVTVDPHRPPDWLGPDLAGDPSGLAERFAPAT
jgi:hypothetical protein